MESLFLLDIGAYLLRVSPNRLQKENNYLIADEKDTDQGNNIYTNDSVHGLCLPTVI